jgi:hypothetical protein
LRHQRKQGQFKELPSRGGHNPTTTKHPSKWKKHPSAETVCAVVGTYFGPEREGAKAVAEARTDKITAQVNFIV